MSTLVAALRSDNPLGGAPLSYADTGDTFTLQGVGEIGAAKLLDLENRRQLVWADPVTREWALELAAMRVRKEKEAAAKQAAWAAEAAAAASAAQLAASAATAAALTAPAAAPDHGTAPTDGPTLVFEPPTNGASRRPAGVRAAQTRFAPPDPDAVRGADTRVVWTEPPADESGEGAPEAPELGATAAAVAAAWVAADPLASRPPETDTLPDWHSASPIDQGVVTRRTDRRSARREAQHRAASSAAWLRIMLYILLAVAVAVVLILMQQGTIGF